MFLALLLAAAQSAQPAPPMGPTAGPPPPGSSPQGAPDAARAGGWRRQVFISPCGEPFRVPQGQSYPVADWFAKADADHDGKLTEAEFVADCQRFAATLDTDRNGSIDGDEIQAYETMIVPEVHTGSWAGFGGGGGGGEDGEGGGSAPRKTPAELDEAPMGAGRYGLINIPEPIASMDTSFNGRVSKDEVADAAGQRFELLDSAQHGYLTLADLPQTFAQAGRVKPGGEGRRRGGGGGGGGPGGWVGE